ncbi:MAG: methyl-accepting chemotaxis protein, partial [Deltaproteobacteria bacterium]|nr:methyl-accepting chemotaxis protein [Deltaproteobacteria bacterium]
MKIHKIKEKNMFKDLTIKARVITTAICIFIISAAIMALFTYKSHMNQLIEVIKDKEQSELSLFPAQVSADADGLARALAGFTRMESLLKPFSERKKEELLAAAKPLFEDIKVKNNITHMYFAEPDGKVLLRVHKPEQSGDKLTRLTYKKASETNKLASGLEMGKNFFSLRAIHPVSYNNSLIGYLEVAQEIDHLIKQLKEITGDDASIFLTDDFLKGKSSEMKNKKAGEFTILDSTNEDIALKLAEKIDMKKGLKELTTTIVDLNNARYAVGIGPFKDVSGDIVGILFFQRDVSGLYSAVWKAIFVNAVLFGIILTASGIMLYLSLRKSLALFNEVKEAIEETTHKWDLTKRINTNKSDEVGVLAKGFNTFMDKFSDIVGTIGGVTNNIASSSEQLSASSTQIAKGAEAQTQKAAQVATAAEQMSATVIEVAKNAS